MHDNAHKQRQIGSNNRCDYANLIVVGKFAFGTWVSCNVANDNCWTTNNTQAEYIQNVGDTQNERDVNPSKFPVPRWIDLRLSNVIGTRGFVLDIFEDAQTNDHKK